MTAVSSENPVLSLHIYVCTNIFRYTMMRLKILFYLFLFSQYLLSIYTMFLSKGSAALLLVITNNKITIIKTCPAGLLGKGLWIVPQRHSGVDCCSP